MASTLWWCLLRGDGTNLIGIEKLTKVWYVESIDLTQGEGNKYAINIYSEYGGLVKIQMPTYQKD